MEEPPHGRNKLGTYWRPWSVEAEDRRIPTLSVDGDVSCLSGGECHGHTCPRRCLPMVVCPNTPNLFYLYVLYLVYLVDFLFKSYKAWVWRLSIFICKPTRAENIQNVLHRRGIGSWILAQTLSNSLQANIFPCNWQSSLHILTMISINLFISHIL